MKKKFEVLLSAEMQKTFLVEAHDADEACALLEKRWQTNVGGTKCPPHVLHACEATIESTTRNHQKDRSNSRREIALLPSGRLRRVYAVENRFRRSGFGMAELRNSIRYICAGRGGILPCDLTVAAMSPAHLQMKCRYNDKTVFEVLVRAAAQKIYMV